MIGGLHTEPPVKRKRGRPPKNSKSAPALEDDRGAAMAVNEGAEEVYEVEAIKGMRVSKNGETQYFIKWVGYDESGNTWQKIDDLNCPELLAEFREALAQNPDLDMTDPSTTFPPNVYKDSWEGLVDAIDGLREIKDEQGKKQIVARILWKCGYETEEVLEDCIEAVPRCMLRFLLTKLKFKGE